MKKCPQCGRDYNDDSMSFCLDDGAELLFGPASGVDRSEPGAIAAGFPPDEPQTAILHETVPPSEAATRAQINTNDQTAIFPRGAEAEPQNNLSDSMEKRSFSAHRAAKPLAAAVIAVVVLVGGFFGYRYFSAANSKQISSIAVMPFENRNSDADTDYLSDGLAESLIFRLTQIADLRVSPTSSVMRYKGKETDVAKIAAELGVDAVMTGRLTKRGDNLNITVELVDARTNKSLWGEQYERKLSQILTTQREIVGEIVGKLQLKLSGESEQKLAKKYTDNNEAYQLYLKGRFYLNKREEKDFRKAIEYYNQAVALDPNFALAFAGLADTYALLSGFGFMASAEAVPRAREFATRALTLDDSLAEPYATLGYLLNQFDHDFVASERELRRSIEINPAYASARQWYGELLTYLGRFDEADAEFRRAMEIEPLSLSVNWEFARFLYMSRRFEESLLQHKKTIELDNGFARAHKTLADLYMVRKDYANAAEEQAKFFELRGESQKAALLRETFAKGGWNECLRLITAEHAPLQENNWNWVLAKAYADLGHKDRAFAELNKVYEYRLSSVVWFKVEPRLDSLRDDPRYKELLKRMNLPE